MDSRVALRFQASRKALDPALTDPTFFNVGNFFETFQACTDNCMHPGLLAVQPHRSMATLSVEGESGLVRGEASVPERLAASAGMGHGHGLKGTSQIRLVP
jgi:hypothetical protein